MTCVTCRLTAKNWDQLWNPTLGSNRVWAIFTFFYLLISATKFQYKKYILTTAELFKRPNEKSADNGNNINFIMETHLYQHL